MTAKIVLELRRAIDAKHGEAIEALKTLQAYLEEPLPPATTRKLPTGRRKRKSKSEPPSRAGTGKIRPAVLAALAGEFLPIKAVAEQTGFSALQVRGVVLAPGLKDRFAKKEINGVMQYKYEGENSE